MEIELNAVEARILGVFIEKELTTPDYYPLSQNALTNACNQKSNRAPVMQLEEADVLENVDSLRKKGLAMQSQDAGSRVSKYRHSLRERLYLEDQELAILAELLLRGPQTPGELRSRCDRMATFPDLAEVERILHDLLEKEPALAIRLERQPGRKECRYAQLFTAVAEQADLTGNAESVAAQTGQTDDMDSLQSVIAELRAELAALQAEFADFKKQFE